MTSTPFNVGLSDERLSSRVLRPPGGGHTDIFGGEPEPPRTGRRMAPNPSAPTPNNVTAETAQNGQAKESPVVAVAAAAASVDAAKPEAESAPPAPAKSAPQQPAVETQKRIRVPPGGFSSGLW